MTITQDNLDHEVPFGSIRIGHRIISVLRNMDRTNPITLRIVQTIRGNNQQEVRYTIADATTNWNHKRISKTEYLQYTEQQKFYMDEGICEELFLSPEGGEWTREFQHSYSKIGRGNRHETGNN